MNPDTTPQEPAPSVEQKPSDALYVTQPGETTVCTIKRHPIGILAVYIMSGFMIIVMALIIFAVIPQFMSGSGKDLAMQIGSIFLLVVVIICAVYSFIATKIYWGNSWVVTTDSITQITHTSLFNRQSSQLSMDNIEDITAEQNGILTHIFNYGIIRVETAGEHSKFQFLYCPNPNFYAQKVISAREAFEQRRDVNKTSLT